MSWLTATYLIDAPADLIEARANALALEQSVECPLEAITDERILDQIVAQVAAIERVGDDRYRVDVDIAVETTGHEPAQLMNMIFGNCSLWENVRLVNVDLPDSLLARFGGPRHGITGIRARVGAYDRALTSTAMKPQGLPTDELAKMCKTFALAGVDIVKDDHGIVDQQASRYAERVAACSRAVEEAAQITGRRTAYAPNLSGTPKVLRERALIARDAGVEVVLVAPMLIGIPAFVELVEEFQEFAYLGHPSAGGGRIAPDLLFGRLFRLFGVDAPIFTNYGGRFAYPPEECAALAEAARAPWGDLKPALPVPAGGMKLERVDEMLHFYGVDTMLLIGGNLLIAREALLERTRDYVAKVAGHGHAAVGAHA
jgi:ribulose-bisphosphate carboxylase large chain